MTCHEKTDVILCVFTATYFKCSHSASQNQ